MRRDAAKAENTRIIKWEKKCNLPNRITCLFIFLIVKWSISHKYNLVNSLFISLEKTHVATAEHSTIWVFSNLSTNTHIIWRWFLHSSNKLCKMQIWPSSDSARVCNYNSSKRWNTKYCRGKFTSHLNAYLEHGVEFCDCSKTMRKTLRTQIQQGLNEDIDFQRIELGVDHFAVKLTGVWQLIENVEYLLGGTFGANRDYQLMGCCGSRQWGWKQEDERV